jgi:hypothetical protein
VDCWGANDWGQAESRTGPFTAVAAASSDTCGIRDDGTVRCWGYSYTKGGVGVVPAGTFAALAGGGDTMCGIRTDGTLACWGEFWAPTPPAGSFSDVAVAGDYACAIDAGGEIRCFGESYGEWDAAPAGTFTDIGLGWGFGCGIRTDGALQCWGQDTYFQGSPPAGTFTGLGVGGMHACAVADAGTFACWGQNRGDQVVPAPAADVVPPPRVTLAATIPVAWTGRPTLAPIADYDVAYRQAPWNGRFGSYVRWLDGTTAQAGGLPAVPGTTVCFAAAATDTEGHTGHRGRLRCTTAPLDDRSLERSSGWDKTAGDRFYRSTALTTRKSGATLSVAGVRASRVDLVATTCPTCGSVAVYLGKWKLKTISLRSATTVTRRVIPVENLGWPSTGRITIKVVSSGRKVQVDGLALWLDPYAAFASTSASASAAAVREPSGVVPAGPAEHPRPR